jgi:transcriptional regulator with XRE-family HTH domain
MKARKSARGSSRRQSKAELSTFGAKVRAARAVLNWSQTELAVRSGLTQRAIWSIEGEINRPRKATESRILSAMSVTGLKIEDTLDGGFTLTVPGAYLRSSGRKRAR